MEVSLQTIMVGFTVLWVVCIVIVGVGAAITSSSKVCYGVLMSVYYRLTGKRPFCLNDEVAMKVAQDHARKNAVEGLAIVNGRDLECAIAALIHQAIVDYAYQFTKSGEDALDKPAPATVVKGIINSLRQPQCGPV